MSSRALPGCRYLAAPSVVVRVVRVDSRHVWLELIVRDQVRGRMTKLHREVFEELFTREGCAAHSPAPPVCDVKGAELARASAAPSSSLPSNNKRRAAMPINHDRPDEDFEACAYDLGYADGTKAGQSQGYEEGRLQGRRDVTLARDGDASATCFVYGLIGLLVGFGIGLGYRSLFDALT